MQTQLQTIKNLATSEGMGEAQDFHVAFNHLIDSEQGFQNDRHDRGNWTSGRIGVGELKGTKYGISAMTYPWVDIKNLTLEDAKAINFVDWWLLLQCDEMNPEIAFQVYDAAYNHGRERAAMWIQEIVGVAADGWIGPITLEAIAKHDSCKLVRSFNHIRLHFFTSLKKWNKFGRGWARRVADNLIA